MMTNQNDGRRAGSKDFVFGVFVIALAAVGLAKLADYVDRTISQNAVINICGDNDNQVNKSTINKVKRANRINLAA